MIDNVTVAQRIEQASRLVTIWSPWWGRYLGSMNFVYGDHHGYRLTGMSAMMIIVENDFIARSGIMDIAVALEFALQQSSRGMDTRAQSMIERHQGVDRDLVGLAQALEINSDISDKLGQLDPVRWARLVTQHIDRSYLKTFDAEEPPILPEGAWTSDDLDLPKSLRAEKYLEILIERENDKESDFLDQGNTDTQEQDDNDLEEDNDSEEKESDSPDRIETPSPTDGNNDDSLSDGSHDNEYEQDKDSDNPPQSDEGEVNDSHSDSSSTSNLSDSTDSESNYDPVNESTDSSDYQENAHDTSSVQQRNNEQGNSEVEDEPDSSDDASTSSGSDESSDSIDPSTSLTSDGSNSSEKGTQSHSEASNVGNEAEGHSKDLNSSESNVEPFNRQNEVSLEGGETQDRNDSKESGNGSSDSEDKPSNQEDDNDIDSLLSPESSTSNSKEKNPGKSLGKYESLADELRRDADDTGMHQMTIPERPQEMKNTPGADQYTKEDVLNELAEDIKEYQDSIPSGGPSMTSDYVEFSRGKLDKPQSTWKKALPRLLTPIMSSAQMSGQSDMSYSKQNPNQQPDLPIMMGFISYPPEITLLIDSSPSMMRGKKKLLSQFVGVMKSFFMRYAQPVTVAIGDSFIQYAESSLTPYSRIMREVGKTHMGTSATFGDVIYKTARKGVKYKNRNFPKPDIMIIMTDCKFPWPWMDRKSPPASCGTIIIISTEKYENVKNILPPWVREGKNFVYIE